MMEKKLEFNQDNGNFRRTKLCRSEKFCMQIKKKTELQPQLKEPIKDNNNQSKIFPKKN